MPRRPGPEVTVYDVKKRTDRVRPRPYSVRWSVGKRSFSRAFPLKAQADDYAARLRIAGRDGDRFDRTTGVPISWDVEEVTVAQWAYRWYREQWPTWASGSRRSASDSLTRALPLLVARTAPALDDRAAAALRHSIVTWLQGTDPDKIPDYLKRWSIQLEDVSLVAAHDVWHALGLSLHGKAYSPNMAARVRRSYTAMVDAAVRKQLVEPIDWPAGTSRRQKVRVTEKYDPAHVPTPAQVEALLDELGPRVTDNRPLKYRTGDVKGRATKDYRPYFGLLAYAGLRPGEAFALDANDCTLPAEGWGSVVVSRTARGDLEEEWLDGDAPEAPVKAGAVGRVVPIPPQLVELLRPAVAGGGRLFSGWSRSAVSKAWTAAKKQAWPAGDLQEAIPYDLRHFNATVMLRAGVPIRVAANRLGHDPRTLVGTYEGLLEGDETRANEAVSRALTRS